MYGELKAKFERQYGRAAEYIFSAPGRTELGGNHTDHQHGLVLVDLHGVFQVVAQLPLVGNDLHSPTAQDEGGAHQHGIADLLGGSNAVFQLRHGLALGSGNVQLVQQLFKFVPILGPVDGGTVRADDGHAPLHQGVCQVDGGLAAQRGNDALGILEVQDVHHILGGQGLKVQLVGGRVVRGDRLRVVVDDDRFVAAFPDRAHRVYRGIVEFHALPDADRTGAEHDHLFLVRYHRLVFVRVGRRKAREPRLAGIDFVGNIAEIGRVVAPVIPDRDGGLAEIARTEAGIRERRNVRGERAVLHMGIARGE